MTNNTDRATGAFFAAFGLLLYFVIIPTYVEVVDGGWVLPETIPNAVSIILGLCAVILMIKPTKHRARNASEFLSAALYFGLLAVALLVMSSVGFVYAAPILALVLMLLIGERRPFWLFMGVVVLPASIWFLVARVLERALP